MRAKKIIASVLTVIVSMVMLSASSLTAAAASKNYAEGYDGVTDDCMVYDEKGILSKKQLRELNEELTDASEELELYIFVMLGDRVMSDDATEIFAADSYDDIFGEYTDGVFLYLDLSGKSSGAYDYLSTSGKAALDYQGDSDSIFSMLNVYLPSTGEKIEADDIYNAVDVFFDALDTYSDCSKYAYATDNGKYGYYRDGEFVITRSKPPILLFYIAMAASAIGLVVAIAYYFITKHKYKFKNAYKSSNYVIKDKTVFRTKTDTFIRSYQTRVRIQSSSGGGGGGGHSGGFHGGGGNHR